MRVCYILFFIDVYLVFFQLYRIGGFAISGGISYRREGFGLERINKTCYFRIGMYVRQYFQI